MGGNVPPQPKVNQVAWFENRLAAWAAAPASFGTTAAAITALTTLVTNARKAYNAAQLARDASKAATTGENTSVASMLTSGRAMVNTMKSFIQASGNPTLWGQAMLSPDAPPGTAPKPTAPFMLSATLDSQGDVIVAWKASQPAGISGVIYSVQRALDGGAYVLLDSVGEKTFTDEAVPVGTQSVSYMVRAKRGPQMSDWSEALTVRFGRGGGGLSILSTESGPEAASRMAA